MADKEEKKPKVEKTDKAPKSEKAEKAERAKAAKGAAKAVPAGEREPEPKGPSRLRKQFDEVIRKKLMEQFGYKNPMQVPRIDKVVLNMGVGEAVNDRKKVDLAAADMAAIAGQKAVITHARKSIATYKLRENHIYVWDLRLIRTQLKELGMDWDWPEFPAPGPERSRAPLKIELDPGIFRRPMFENDRDGVAALSVLLGFQPLNPELYFQRGLARGRLNESKNAIADYEMFLALARKDDSRRPELLMRRATNYMEFKDDPRAISALLDVATVLPELNPWPGRFVQLCNNSAWAAVKASTSKVGWNDIVRLSSAAVAYEPHNFLCQNTLGAVFYRAGQYRDAIRCLDTNLLRSGKYVAFDLYFLAMSHQRLGDRDKARGFLDRANASVAAETSLSREHQKELAAFRAEAEALLGVDQGK